MPVQTLKDAQTLEAYCNWDSNIPGKDIVDTVVLSQDDEAVILSDHVNVDTTVSFMVPDQGLDRHTDKPLVRFTIPPQESSCINSIVVLCDSKVIEVFGDHSIYLDTVHSKTIEESAEFNVFECSIDLSKRVNKEVTLKFVKPARPNWVWVYGILLKMKKITPSASSSKINFDNVQDLLKNAHISEQADKSFNFLRDANNTSARFSANGDCFSQCSENTLTPPIKTYIDHKFQILTDYLILRERSIHDKLDRVIELIKSKN